MKNHVKVDGRLLQTNKKWLHLKAKQRAWIFEVAGEEHAAFVAEHKRLPFKRQKEALIDRVYDRISEREIWISYYEVKIHVGKYIDQRNRKSPLFKSSEIEAEEK